MVRNWMMVLVLLSLFTLASEVEAGDLTCEIPWHSGFVSCNQLFSVRPHEEVTIQLLSVVDSDGNERSECTEIKIVDAQTAYSVANKTLCNKTKLKIYKNESDTELIAGIMINVPMSLT